MKKIIFSTILFTLGVVVFGQNPIILKDIYPGATGSGIQQIVKTSNYTFFNAEDDDADLNRGLYRTDGSAAGTIKLNLVYPTYNSTKAEKLTALGDKVIFAGDNSTNYGEIWASDGTQAGTIAIERFQPTAGSAPVMDITKMGSVVLYGILDNNNHSILKKTDGTISGTSLVYDFSSFASPPQLGLFQAINGVLYFNVYDIGGTGADQLWRSDGTTAGTYMLKDFGLDHYVASGYMPSGGLFYVMTVKPGIGNELWKSDGTVAGTVPVKLIGTTPNNNNYPQYAAINSFLLFAGNDAGGGKELWITDGTDAGTHQVADINPGTASSNPSNLTVLNDNIYFSATISGVNKLLKFDGSTVSTIKDITCAASGNGLSLFAVSNNTIVFRGSTSISGSELWITDGTTANTLQVADINPGVASSNPSLLTPGIPIYFSANNGVNGVEIFKYDNSDGINGVPKLFYVNDNSNTGDVFTTAIGSDSNPGSAALPFATIQHAQDIATAGSIIYVDAGIYTEQVTLSKGLSIFGVNSSATIILKPAIINPPPGPFTEPGTIQSVQNIGDVHIKDMSITGDNNGVPPIVLQTGGSVKNCRLIGGSQGIFFRVDPAIKSALIENNYISVEYIGINCQGSGLTATLINNAIDLNNTNFAAGVFAGLDFGPLVQFTAIGNSINRYNYVGFLANSYNTNITQNSILGTTGKAIQQESGYTTVATCNWFGTTNVGAVAGKISGNVTYTPFLNNGTDNNVVYGEYGFQPVPGSCAGNNNYYVNDISRTNDTFTTAVGNNSNNGSSSSPFATLSYAISQAVANDFIYVDAGTYAEQVTINKGITIIGAGSLLTSFINPIAALVPPPGSFPEYGLIQTTQNIGDVFISNLSVTNTPAGQGHNIMIQSGGSVYQCRLINGGQGVFFRVDPSNNPLSKNALISNNYIQPTGIGVNVTGTNLSATIQNNKITNTTPYYSSIFAGQDFNPMASVTIYQNIINNYFGPGVEYRSNFGFISKNSITGTGTFAIEKTGGNTPIATCNWFGSADQNIVIAKINGSVNYRPWLTSGTNTDATFGFIPLPDVCTGRQDKFYVNDNSNAGNVFTTNVGNDGNSGIPSAPLLTINAALVNAQAGDTIIVDSGSFTEGVTVTKNITIRGAGMGATILNGPATHIIPLSGTSETGIIQSVAGLTDVIIENMTIDGTNSDESHGTFIQGGGRISNCELRYVNDGFYFQYISSQPRTATGNNNYVHHINYVGALFAGNGLTAIANNNIIDLNGASYGIGFIGGYGGEGNLASFSASNNTFINFNGFGMLIGSSQSAQVHNNSFTRISGNYIQNAHNVNIDATCNWYGTNSAAVINKNITGTVNFSPWLNNGTDNDVTFGFQPVPGSCNGVRLSATLDEHTNVTCKGGNNGTINITVTSGVAPYSFVWTKDNDAGFSSITEDPVNFTAGTYHVTITDASGTNILVDNNGNIYTINVIITEPQLLIANASGTNNLCFGNSIGTASVSVSGGTTPYTYLWSNGSTSNEITDLLSGLYTVTVRDANGCTIEASYEVTQPALLTATASGKNNLCFGNSIGTASVSVGGGITPYTYLWSNGSTSNEITNLLSGLYTVTITDTNGCSKQASYEVKQPALLIANAGGTNVSCFGGNDGTVSVTVIGGTTSYTYLWSNGVTTASMLNLVAGIYSVTITDANGCIVNSSYEVTQPTPLTVSLTGTTASCNGSANATVAGGTAPYTYSWSNGAITQSISNVQAGTYTVTVTDVKGCTKSGSYTITGGSPINPQATLIAVSCFGQSNGSITVTSAGGLAPYLYNINGANFQGNNVFNNLPAGIYIVGIKDTNGCSDFITKTIIQPALLLVTMNSVQSTCAGQSTGSISITTSGGSGALGYKWTGPNGYISTQKNPSNLATGSYILLVTDNNGCTANLNVVVPTFNSITVSGVVTNVLCKGAINGAINISATGGTGTGFSYSWTGAIISSNEDLSNLAKGNYNLKITDNGSGCFISTSYTVTEPASNLAFSTSKTNATGCSGSLGIITVTASGGTSPYTYNLNGGSYGNTNSFTGLYSGNYTVGVKDVNGCFKTAVVSITDNGSDAYESNNSKSQAKLILIAGQVNARIALATDIADWFKFTTVGAGNYVLNMSHPSVNYTFNLYATGNNTPALVPVISSSTSKQYNNLAANATYYVQITGGLSYNCYSLMVMTAAPSIVAKTASVEKVIPKDNGAILKAIAYPNPHRGSFDIQIETPALGKAEIELFTASGQLLAERTINLEVGANNIVSFTDMFQGMIFYRIQIGNQFLNGKIIGTIK